MGNHQTRRATFDVAASNGKPRLMPSSSEIRTQLRQLWAKRREMLGAEGDNGTAQLSKIRDSFAVLVDEARQVEDDSTTAQAVHLLANLESDLGNLTAAASLWNEAVSILRTLDNPVQLAHKVRHLGSVLVQLGRHADGLDHFAEAIRLYRSSDEADALDHANAANAYAYACKQAGDFDRAHELWLEARNLYDEAGIKEGVDECNVQLMSN